MKILLTREMFHPTGWDYGQDYLSDGLLHGLRGMFGDSVVDSPRLWYMYKKEFTPYTHVIPQHILYGRGFTLNALMDEGNIDRTDIEDKIRNRYFDLIVFSRPDFGSPYGELIMQHYPPEQILFLDGKDGDWIHDIAINRGIYLKRELKQRIDNVFPVSFGFPREKVRTPIEKIQMMCPVDPRDRSTYTHWIESAYYDDYNRSLFGVTTCKGGWDCMRHYEIIGSRCIPLFLDLADCPELICTTLPKALLLDVLHKVQNFKYFDYKAVEEQLHEHFMNNCLTEHLAEYVLDHYTKAKLNSHISNI